MKNKQYLKLRELEYQQFELNTKSIDFDQKFICTIIFKVYLFIIFRKINIKIKLIEL